MTWPPTIADDPETLQTHKKHPGLPDTPTCTVVAPCCGRECAADMVVDLRDVPGTVIRPGGVGTETDPDWACDGCRTRIIRSDRNPWTDSQLARALGAPTEVQARKRAQEMLRVKRQSMGKKDRIAPRVFLEERRQEVGGQGPVPGTEPPISR